MYTPLFYSTGGDKCTPLLWPCTFSCWRGGSCVCVCTSAGPCCLLVCVLVRRNSMGSKLWALVLLHPILGGYRTRWQRGDSWQHLSQGSNCCAECLPLPRITPQSLVSFYFSCFSRWFFSQKPVGNPLVAANPVDPCCKQTLSLFISCFGVTFSWEVLGVLSLHAVSTLFSYNGLLFKTGPPGGFVTLKLDWYKITIITFYGFDR